MKKEFALGSIVILLFGTISCAVFSSLVPTATAPPPMQPTKAQELAGTETPTTTRIETLPMATEGGFMLSLPEGEPVSVWHEVPIMPGAINGEESDSNSYIFTTKSTREEIAEYYERELPKVGWELLGIGDGGEGTVLMLFTGDSGSFTVSIFEVDEVDGLYYVILIEP